ncbi:Holliday junction branch migration protein RuvA [Aestuariimicrobium ganziense]|uniref:Holliday junction branch migration protein RuvA n=1 Tax=Aestuariimicrobium ganziense TaxID=2773677 RepID=UPI00194592BF|nr:Holliday junction branch migration protein RuvA [Aestuariimicrobium ganziense]
MISQLRGTVVAAGATWVVLDLSGFGVRALCPPATAAGVRLGEESVLHTSLVVREDSLTLYGFADATERDAFELVQTASGVGPKLAQAIVSVLSPSDLVQAISTENLTRLCAVPGIGRKGAQKLVIELKDKVLSLGVDTPAAPAVSSADQAWREQVTDGLVGLGWSARDAEAACDAVAPMAADDPSVGVATLMRAALKSLAR